jgi:hypothetical protein
MADTFDIAKQTLPGGNTNKPASGTYGDQKNLDDLKASFPQAPSMPGSASGGPAPMPTPPSGGGVSTAPAPGLPSALLAPTTRPGTPVGTPLGAPPVNPVQAAATARQRNMAVLDALVNDPNVSTTTREWARSVMGNLIKGSKG